MSSGDPVARRSTEIVLTLGVFAALFAAMMPLMRVIDTGWWVLGSVVISAAVLLAGYTSRWFRLPALAVSLIEAGVWIAFMTVVFVRDTAFLGVIPTPETFRTVPGLVMNAVDEIVLGAAPLEPGIPLSFFICGAMGLLAIAIDHVVITARMPLLAAVGLIAISLIPSIAVPGEIDITAFVLLAAAMLLLLRAETRTREQSARANDAPARGAVSEQIGIPTPTGVSATALGIGAIAVIVAIVATPLLPPPTRPGFGPGVGASIDPSLQLGDDLRRPNDMEVLVVRSDAPSSPYLRAATLSAFDGDVWEPDRSRALPLDSEEGLTPVEVDDGIRIAEYTTSVEVRNLASPWLPIAFPAVEVTGLEGDWSAIPYNRTVVSRTGTAQGQTYQVVSEVPRPTLEQIRARGAVGTDAREETTELPRTLPPMIGDLAAEIVAEAVTDYDKLVALQTWFRGSQFRYSLEAPVEEGFDGSGAEAVARFLEVREGYCVHFASAFALMARTLGMPARIVVGYLPGSNTSSMIERQTVYSVSNSRLHAWPEVLFEGIGWVQFEPTNSLGTPTSFSSGSTTPGGPSDLPSDAPLPQETTLPSTAATPTASGGPEFGGPDAGAETSGLNPAPILAGVLGILLALALPALIRDLRRRQLLAAAHGGDAAAAWITVQDAAIDLGIDVPGSESARSLGTRLVAEHGAPADAMMSLIHGIERASYAPGGRHGFWLGPQMAEAATAVRSGMLASVDRPRRMLAVLVPRSLVVRPGSAYAGSGKAVRAR